MKYKIVHTRETDNYTRHLEELSEKGFRVISAGMTANPALKCFDWWAVLEETPVDVVFKKPGDDAAELLEAARKIAKTCEKHEKCSRCPLVIDGCCAVRVRDAIGGLPCNWWAVRRADNV